jgi:hypothetical protein
MVAPGVERRGTDSIRCPSAHSNVFASFRVALVPREKTVVAGANGQACRNVPRVSRRERAPTSRAEPARAARPCAGAMLRGEMVTCTASLSPSGHAEWFSALQGTELVGLVFRSEVRRVMDCTDRLPTRTAIRSIRPAYAFGDGGTRGQRGTWRARTESDVRRWRDLASWWAERVSLPVAPVIASRDYTRRHTGGDGGDGRAQAERQAAHLIPMVASPTMQMSDHPVSNAGAAAV